MAAIKQRYDRVTQKRRIVLPYHEALRLCNDRQIPDHGSGDRALIEEVHAFLQTNYIPFPEFLHQIYTAFRYNGTITI